MKNIVKNKPKTRRTCLERSQLKMLFDVLRRKRKCNAADEFIEEIDMEFDVNGKKKKKAAKREESWLDGWFE